MALIKCPQCGQSVLSVASTCPKCSYLFLEAPKEESAAGALVECRRCSKRIPPDAASCPYCAYPIRRVVLLRRAAVAAGVTGVTLVVLVFALARRGGPEPAVASVAAQPEAATPTPERTGSGQPALDSTESVTEPATRGDSAPTRVAARSPSTLSAPARIGRSDTAVGSRRPPPEPPRTAGERETRWSLNWVNVREGRGTANAIVTVLQPGVQVELADRRGGWWAVYVDGTFVGYASGSLFGSEPPTTNGVN